MPDAKAYFRRALEARDLMRRDRASGIQAFGRLLRERPHDGMIHLRYAEGLEGINALDDARSHFERAERHLWDPAWKETALQGRARCASTEVSDAARDPSAPPKPPSEAQLDLAKQEFWKREPRAVVYEAALELQRQALDRRGTLSVAVPAAALLQSWNFAVYGNAIARFDGEHFSSLERLLEAQHDRLLAFRPRAITSLGPGDEDNARSLFGSLQQLVHRVGAAKVLHLWAPDFFPIWDQYIALAYGIDFQTGGDKSKDYWRFMLLVKAQVSAMPAVYGQSALKALDEFNYCKYSKKWI